ncbi:MAG: alanine:cation symporter family protein [Alphaproteobacteria bacterium]|nr:MAG: alanine:cation symporter family protein [Alphaproteobacteria bacterium]
MSGFTTVVPAAAGESSLDQRINETIGPFTDAFSGIIFSAIPVNGVDFPIIVMWLITAGVLLTFYTRFTNLRQMGLAFRIVRGDYDDPADKGEVTHFQALSAALSGTIGLGNIAGVAVAIGLGGPGATFWMIVAGLFGMTTKFVECTLATKYRKIRADGVVSGGPMYYLKQGLAEKGMPRLGASLAVIFAIFCVCGSFGGGNMFQVNQALQQVEAITGGTESLFYGRGWIFGVLMAGFVALVIIGGIRSIARVTGKLVPIMCAIYVAAAITILVGHASEIPAAIGAILAGAFSPEGIGGGIVGVLIQGFRRATFSNEAGVGSAPIAHAAVKTNEPVTEGLVALLEPFIDTVVICTMTALVIVITGTYQQTDLDGVSMTSAAFGDVISWFPIILSVAVVLFAFSTQITWSYYGLKAWTYLLGETRLAELSYKVLFCTATVIGASLSLDKVVDFSDAAIFAMSLPNLIGVYILAPVARKELQNFLARIKSGEVTVRMGV